MSVYQLRFTTQAQRDAKKLLLSGLKDRAEKLLDIIAKDPAPKHEAILSDYFSHQFL